MSEDKVKITIWPETQSFEVEKGAKLMTALKENGYEINSSCGGCASCSDCIVLIKAGEDNLSAQEFPELKLLGNVFHITKERLSCQTLVLGDVSVDISKHKDKSIKKKFEQKKSGSVVVKKREVVEQETKEKEVAREEKYQKWKSEQGNKGGFKKAKPFFIKDSDE